MGSALAASNVARGGIRFVTSLVIARALFLPIAALASSGATTAWIGGVSAEMVPAAILLAAAGLAYGTFASVCRAAPRPLVSILAIETAGALVQCGGSAVMVTRGAHVP